MSQLTDKGLTALDRLRLFASDPVNWAFTSHDADQLLSEIDTLSPGHAREGGEPRQDAPAQHASPVPRITDRERPVLQALHELTLPHGELCVPFRAISGEPSNSAATQEVRRIVRALARKGCAQFVRGLFDDAGEMRGSGYCITPTGIAALAPTRTPPAPVAPVELDPVLNAEKN